MYTHKISLDSLLRCSTTIIVPKVFPSFLTKLTGWKEISYQQIQSTLFFSGIFRCIRKKMGFVHSHFCPLVLSKNVVCIYKSGRSCKVREEFSGNSGVPGFIQQRPDTFGLHGKKRTSENHTSLPSNWILSRYLCTLILNQLKLASLG